MNALNHLLDYRTSLATNENNFCFFAASEIYLYRVKKFLSKKQKTRVENGFNFAILERNSLLGKFGKICKRLYLTIGDKYKQIVLIATNNSSCVAAQDLSLATSFIVAVLFLMVKASRPMTYQNLTVAMIKEIKEDGWIH